MMKTPDDIKKGLSVCMGYVECCAICPYYSDNECQRVLKTDALAHIHQLETGIDERNKQLMQLEEGSKKVMNMLSVVSDHSAAINEAAIHAVEQMANRIPRWISVEEKKPPRHMGEYLCWCALDDDTEHKWDLAMVLRWHAIEGNGVVDRPHFTDEGVNGMYVTHWMPLPEPPKEE